MIRPLTAPFPWFGGKRRVAAVAWEALGADVPNYIEPFAGSLAVLLGRPGGAGKIETVNDRDCYLANFWRAVTADPIAVAQWADWPVNEADLHARHAWLVGEIETHRARMHADPDYYDEKIAGWWVWGICQWIGSGWCVEPNNHKRPSLDGIGKGLHASHAHPRSRMSRSRQRPFMRGDSQGMGVLSQQLPNLRVTDGASGSGVHRRNNWNHNGNYWVNRRPDLTNAHGVHLPSLGNDRGLNGNAAAPCIEWFLCLKERMRRVRVACGDWQRVLGRSVLGKGENVGGRRPCAVFLDPPYSHELRDAGLYSEDEASLSDQVREWALAHGDDPELRIALCGYDGEHRMPSSWRVYQWRGARGFAGEHNTNRERERIWFSPHCLGGRQMSLFEESASV